MKCLCHETVSFLVSLYNPASGNPSPGPGFHYAPDAYVHALILPVLRGRTRLDVRTGAKPFAIRFLPGITRALIKKPCQGAASRRKRYFG